MNGVICECCKLRCEITTKRKLHINNYWIAINLCYECSDELPERLDPETCELSIETLNNIFKIKKRCVKCKTLCPIFNINFDVDFGLICHLCLMKHYLGIKKNLKLYCSFSEGCRKIVREFGKNDEKMCKYLPISYCHKCFLDDSTGSNLSLSSKYSYYSDSNIYII